MVLKMSYIACTTTVSEKDNILETSYLMTSKRKDLDKDVIKE